MSFQNKIENQLMSGGWEKNYWAINFICANEFNWSYKELNETPIPFVLKLVKEWEKVKKAEKNAARKRR